MPYRALSPAQPNECFRPSFSKAQLGSSACIRAQPPEFPDALPARNVLILTSLVQVYGLHTSSGKPSFSSTCPVPNLSSPAGFSQPWTIQIGECLRSLPACGIPHTPSLVQVVQPAYQAGLVNDSDLHLSWSAHFEAYLGQYSFCTSPWRNSQEFDSQAFLVLWNHLWLLDQDRNSTLTIWKVELLTIYTWTGTNPAWATARTEPKHHATGARISNQTKKQWNMLRSHHKNTSSIKG